MAASFILESMSIGMNYLLYSRT